MHFYLESIDFQSLGQEIQSLGLKFTDESLESIDHSEHFYRHEHGSRRDHLYRRDDGIILLKRLNYLRKSVCL